MFVILKLLNNPATITSEFINKIAVSHKVHGITQDLETKNFMVVLNASNILEFMNKIAVSHEVYGITQDSETKNFMVVLNDICEKSNITSEFINKIVIPHGVYGITQDPEIKNYMGIFNDIAKWIDGYIDEWDDYNQNWKRKDQNMVVALKSLNNSKNVTLEFMNEITLHYKVNLHKSEEIEKTLSNWFRETYDPKSNGYAELNNQIKEAEIINKKSLINSTTSLGISYKTHSEAIYTSRLLDFNNLPEPKNSDDYYEENENIISMKFSESLQIDISQLKNNNSFELKNSDDSYEKNDNIKMESSEFLQINTLQLKIDNNNFPEQDNSDDSYEKNDNTISRNSSESLQIDIFQSNTNKDDQDSNSKGKEKI
ncbi:kinase-like domain-containing protein [Rhizophagus irregularis DAOM 181602=DAOM 197198]|nr:kinase-like domain-containing protein [Rhizophagus irregularis DAOM 181602=DAOM 197198]